MRVVGFLVIQCLFSSFADGLALRGIGFADMFCAGGACRVRKADAMIAPVIELDEVGIELTIDGADKTAPETDDCVDAVTAPTISGASYESYVTAKDFLGNLKTNLSKMPPVQVKRFQQVIDRLDTADADLFKIIMKTGATMADIDEYVREIFKFVTDTYGGEHYFPCGIKKYSDMAKKYCLTAKNDFLTNELLKFTDAVDMSEPGMTDMTWKLWFSFSWVTTGIELFVKGGKYHYKHRPNYQGMWWRDYLGERDGLLRVVPDSYFEGCSSSSTCSPTFAYTDQHIKHHCQTYDLDRRDDPSLARMYPRTTVQKEFDLVRMGEIDLEDLELLRRQLLFVIRKFGTQNVVLDMAKVTSEFLRLMETEPVLGENERPREVLEIRFFHPNSWKWHVDSYYNGFPVTLLTLLGPGTVFLKKGKTFHYTKQEVGDKVVFEPIITESALTKKPASGFGLDVPDFEPFELSNFASTQIVNDEHNVDFLLHNTPTSVHGHDDDKEEAIERITVKHFDKRVQKEEPWDYEDVKRVLVNFKDFEKRSDHTHENMLRCLLNSLTKVFDQGFAEST